MSTGYYATVSFHGDDVDLHVYRDDGAPVFGDLVLVGKDAPWRPAAAQRLALAGYTVAGEWRWWVVEQRWRVDVEAPEPPGPPNFT